MMLAPLRFCYRGIAAAKNTATQELPVSSNTTEMNDWMVVFCLFFRQTYERTKKTPYNSRR
jgi:hypothetical protein